MKFVSERLCTRANTHTQTLVFSIKVDLSLLRKVKINEAVNEGSLWKCICWVLGHHSQALSYLFRERGGGRSFKPSSFCPQKVILWRNIWDTVVFLCWQVTDSNWICSSTNTTSVKIKFSRKCQHKGLSSAWDTENVAKVLLLAYFWFIPI